LGSRSEYLMGEAQFLKNIGFRIQYFRKKANLSQEQLAEKSDLSYSTISHTLYSSRIKARSSFGKEFYQWRKNDVITKAAF